MTASLRAIRVTHILIECWAESCRELPEQGKNFCPKHVARGKRRIEKTREKNAVGLCAMVYCRNKKIDSRVYCQLHADQRALAAWEIFCTVIDGYGGQCICCKEHIKQYLELDHINNDGKADREINCAGTPYFRQLIKAGFPPGLQVLCGNCHNAKTKQMVCHGRYWT